MPRLTDYERKRDRSKTPEPFGGKGRKGKRPIFVVQRHQARALHYDFRLERDGALASWAVPKGVPLETGQRHLAVHVEDHPLEYATFAGEIPKGSYGAGTVEIWDSGTYELVEEKPDGGLTVRLEGERLEGLWTLIPAKLGGQEKNWLLVRKSGETPVSKKYAPMLATLAEDIPKEKGWLFEVKWDGYRTLAYLRGGEVKLVSRRDNDLTERFATVARALPGAIRTPDAVLDGEVCAIDEDGRASFSAMQQGGANLLYYVFDVLELDGEPLVRLPYTERQERLREVLDPKSKVVRLSDAFEDGPALVRAVKQQRLEGVMAKKARSVYEPGRRSRNWLKVKTTERQEFLIAGYTKGQGRRSSSLGALVLAVREGKELRWVGNCGTGFGEDELAAAPGQAAPARAQDVTVRPGAEDGQGEGRGRGLGDAEARLRGRVRRVDARPAPARAALRWAS